MLDNTSYDPASATSSASAFFSGPQKSGALGKNYILTCRGENDARIVSTG
jgi:hypothetical protein